MLYNAGSFVFFCHLRVRINPRLWQRSSISIKKKKRLVCFKSWKRAKKEAVKKKRKRNETEGPRAAAACGRIRVNREGGMLRRNEALMDKGDWNVCCTDHVCVHIVLKQWLSICMSSICSCVCFYYRYNNTHTHSWVTQKKSNITCILML